MKEAADVSSSSIIKNNLDSWHKFIPHRNEMTSSNCWYVQNFDVLPASLTQKMTNLNFYVDIEKWFEEDEVEMIMKRLLGSSNHTLFTEHQTDNYFCVPTVFLIGFPKCGTTLLYKYFESHPLFAKPRWKEDEFWRDFTKTSNIKYKQLQVLIYLFHFFGASDKMRRNTNMFTVDASASTVFAASQLFGSFDKDICFVPWILHNTLPQSKVVIIMRNPVDRLWSDFWYFCSRSRWKSNDKYKIPKKITLVASEIFHNHSISIIEQFHKCISSGHSELYCTNLTGSTPGHEAGCKDLRLGLSIYYLHVLRWFSIFPQNQILLIRMEDLSADPLSTMKLIWSFIDVQRTNSVIKDKVNKNPWITSSEYAANFRMWPETRNILREFFNPYNIKLAKLLKDERYLWNDV